jgi:hypothetical protein
VDQGWTVGPSDAGRGQKGLVEGVNLSRLNRVARVVNLTAEKSAAACGIK